MSMESIRTYKESYAYIQSILNTICSAEKIVIDYRKLDGETARYLRDRIRNYLSSIIGKYNISRGERDFVKDDYKEFLNRLEKANSTNIFTVTVDKLKDEHAEKLVALIIETLNVRKRKVWQTILGWTSKL